MEDRSNFALIALVAIVAVVALVVMVTGRGVSVQPVSEGVSLPVVGEAGKIYKREVRKPIISPRRCRDSDGGLDYYGKGTISGNMPPQYMNDDMCLTSGPYNLRETYCDPKDSNGDGYIGTAMLYYCEYGCADGACLSQPPPGDCVDTDGGPNFNTKGGIFGSSIPPNYLNEDRCIENPQYNLRETFCEPVDSDGDGYLGTSMLHDCPNGCLDGACSP